MDRHSLPATQTTLISIVRFGDVQLGPDDLWFTSEQSDGRIGLTLFVRGLTEENHQTLGGAAFILLDSALGEYVVETAIGFIEWRPLPGDPPGAGPDAVPPAS